MPAATFLPGPQFRFGDCAKIAEVLVYAVLVSLALLALLLVLNAPAGIMNSRAVYQGF